MKQNIEFNLELIRRYDKSGPRYTSYPTAVQFHEDFGELQYRQLASLSNQQAGRRPLSLYFHLPFCDTICFYCACNKIVTKNRKHAKPYLENLYREIELQGQLFDSERPVDQLHWGGGTPTFLSNEQMTELMRHTREHFNLLDNDQGEYSIEIDPREADAAKVELLRNLGFNRMSLGVQDFDPKVQKAVNRIQTEAETMAVLNAAREQGFRSVSIDLIYGLPFQSEASFSQTLDKIINVSPDRLSVFNYAHLPEMFKTQRQINAEDLPSAEEKLNILQRSIEQLSAAGYVYIGMDHFARPDDELAVAQRDGSLYRNFQGYSTHADCDLVAMGITGIGKIGNSYSQNVRTVDEYSACLDAGRLPVFRGVELGPDDLLRREIITRLICNFVLDIKGLEKQFNIDFIEYFEVEQSELRQMHDDGLINYSSDSIQVLPAGRLLIRNVCMVFDRYLRERKEQHYSKVI